MKNWDEDVRDRSRQRASSGKQPLVVRHTDENLQMDDVLARLERLESVSKPPGSELKDGERNPAMKFDLKTIVAICAIFLSMTGYVIEDARNTSRQDAEIESTRMRVTNLEKIASANTESRIRAEVELGELRRGQAEIKEMLRMHENETRAVLRRK